MVKLHKVPQDDGPPSTGGSEADRLSISGDTTFKGYRRKRLVRIKVLKMLTPRRAGPVSPNEIGPEAARDATASGSGTVTPRSYGSCDSGLEYFLSTGRTGRRNAILPDVGQHVETGVSDLPDRFEKLTTDSDQSGKGGQDPNTPGTSKQRG